MVTDNRSPDATSDGLAERNTTEFIWASHRSQSRAPNDWQAEKDRRYLDRQYAIETARLVKLAELKTERDFHESEATRKQTVPAQAAASPAPVGAVGASEIKEERQDRRLKLCEDAGLVMPKSHLSRLPDGVGSIANRKGVTRQAFSTDVKAALKRRESAVREGETVSRP